MKTRTIAATLVAAGAIAAGTIAPTAGAAGCIDTGYLSAYLATKYHADNAIADAGRGEYGSAAAEWLAAWRMERTTPMPCSHWLRVSRTDMLRAFADYRQAQADNASASGDPNALIAVGDHEVSLANAATATYGSVTFNN
jgi:hypothetical protein